MSEFDAANICKVAEVLLIYCQGRIDHVVPTLMQLCMNRLTVAKKSELKAYLFVVVRLSVIAWTALMVIHSSF